VSLSGGDSVRRNALLSFVALAVPAVFTLCLTLYLVRVLGPESYGVFALAMAAGLLFLLPSDLGISQSTARFVAEHRTRAAVAAVLSGALQLKLISGVVVAVGMFALAPTIASIYGEDDLVWPLRGMALAVLAQGLMVFWNTAFVALLRVALSLRVVLCESVAEVAASVVLVMLGSGATGAAFGRAFGYGLAATVAGVLMYRLLGKQAVNVLHAAGGEVRRIARYASALFIVDGAYSAFLAVSPLIIGAFLTAREVGVYGAPFRLIYALTYVGLAVANGVAPRMAHGSDAPSARVFVMWLRYLLVVQTALSVAIFVYAEPMVDIVLGSDYSDALNVIRVLSVFVFLSGFAPLFALSINYVGEARKRIPVAIGALAMNIVLTVALVPMMGVTGAAIGVSAAMLVYTGGHFWLCKRAFDLPLSQLGKTAARCVVAAGAMAATAYLFDSADAGIVLLFAGATIALGVFAVLLVVLGELSRRERAIIIGWATRNGR
jgi:O-antigen/teichoic acid export membrane protein